MTHPGAVADRCPHDEKEAVRPVELGDAPLQTDAEIEARRFAAGRIASPLGEHVAGARLRAGDGLRVVRWLFCDARGDGDGLDRGVVEDAVDRIAYCAPLDRVSTADADSHRRILDTGVPGGCDCGERTVRNTAVVLQ